MKKQFKLLGLTVAVLAVMLCITACGKWEDPYKALEKEGYSVSVRFDAGEGVFTNTEDVFVVDVFSMADMKTNGEGERYTYLLTPDDTRRGQSAYAVSYDGHFLAGWYMERTLRVNDKGEALDEYGRLCSESGKPQGYVYAKPWDFSKPLTIDPDGDYTAGENYMTLYAAWVPYFDFEFYAVNGDGTTTHLQTIQAISLDLPEWNKSTGKIDMKKYPTREDMTFEAAYLDAALTEAAPTALTGSWDAETATSTTDTIKVYTTWMEGECFHIYTAEQFKNNSRLGGHYILQDDLDFTNVIWSNTLAQGVFTGKIIGNGHTISGVTVTQADRTDKEPTYFGGIFGSLGETAEFRDVHFENITYKIAAGSRMQGVSFGLLAGVVADNAVFENVTVGGQLVVSTMNLPGDYSMGLICGTGTAEGVDHANVTATVAESISASVEINDTTGEVTVNFGS